MSSTHLQLQAKINFQNTSGSNCWICNNLLSTNTCNWNRKQLQDV